MSHYHVKTDTMDGLGCWREREGAERSAQDRRGDGAYTAHQLKGGWRVEGPCNCWQGEYVLRKREEQTP